MRLKIIVCIAFASVCVTQGLPRYRPESIEEWRNVNRDETKSNKPAEVHRTLLFPKTDKKFLVTENPVRSTTSSHSYRYVLAKRPFMLNFGPSKPLVRDQPIDDESLMKKIKFVVSTPSPFRKEDNESNKHPIHIKRNDTKDDTKDKDGVPEIYVNEIEKPLESKEPSKEEKEIIVLPINSHDKKSNSDNLAKEIAYIMKEFQKNDNLSSSTQKNTQSILIEIETTTENQPKISRQRDIDLDLTRKSDYPVFKNSIDNQIYNPDDYEKNVIYEITPKTMPSNDGSTTENCEPEKESATESYEKSDSNNDKPEVEVIFVAVDDNNPKYEPKPNQNHNNLPENTFTMPPLTEVSDLPKYPVDKSERSELKEEVIIIPVQLDTSTHSNPSSVTPEMEITTEKLPTTERREDKQDPWLQPKKNNRNQNPDDDIQDVIYEIIKSTNMPTTEQTPLIEIKETTPYSANLTPELKTEKPEVEVIFIPISTNAPKTEHTSEKMPVTEASIDSSTTNGILLQSTSKNPILNTPEIINPEVIIIPINIEEIESYPKENRDLEEKNATHNYPRSKTTAQQVSTTPVERITEPTLTTTKSSEVVYVPLNLEDFKDHPDSVMKSLKNYVNHMNKSEPSHDYSTTFTTESTTINLVTTVTPANETEHNMTTSQQNASKLEQHETTTTTEKINHKIVYIPIDLDELKSLQEDKHSTTVKYEENTTETTQNTTQSSSTTPQIIKTTTPAVSSTIKNDVTPTTESFTTKNSSDVVYIPVSLGDLESNPEIAKEVKDVINHMNNLHTTTETSKLPEYTESTESTTTEHSTTTRLTTQETTSTETTTTTGADKTTEKESSEKVVPTKSTSIETTTPPATTSIDVVNHPRKIVYIPFDLSELKSNPDLIADELKNIVDNINNKEKHPENGTATDSSNNGVTSTPQSDQEHPTSTKPHIAHEPLVATIPIVDNDDDINVGYVIRSRDFWNKIHSTPKPEIQKTTSSN